MTTFFSSLRKSLVDIHYTEHSGWPKSTQPQQESGTIDGEASAGALQLTFPIKQLKPEAKPSDEELQLKPKKQLKLEPEPPKPAKNLLDELLKEFEETWSEILGLFGFDIGDDHVKVHNKTPMSPQKMQGLMQRFQEVFNQLARQKQIPVQLEEPSKKPVNTTTPRPRFRG